MVNWQKSFPVLGALAIATSPALGGFTHFPLVVEAKSQEISLQFPPTSDRGTPRTTTGGGTRGEPTVCTNTKEGELSLNALTPNYSNVATTATATPTLYFYVPSTKVSTGELRIADEKDNDVYQTTFIPPKQPGIVKLTIPATASLQPGKQYNWEFRIVCKNRSRYRDVSVEGQLEYKELDEPVKKSLEKKKPLEGAKIYAANGIWLETLDNIAKVRSSNPTEWTELLDSVGLKAVSDQPFVECCQIESQSPVP